MGRFLCRFQRSPSAFPVPIRLHSPKTPIPQLSNNYLSFCFGDTFLAIAIHRFTFTLARLEKKSAHLFVFQPFIILFSCYRLSLPFLSVFLFSYDAAWIRWFWVFVGLKNGARWGCIFFWSPLFFGGLLWTFLQSKLLPRHFSHMRCVAAGVTFVPFLDNANKHHTFDSCNMGVIVSARMEKSSRRRHHSNLTILVGIRDMQCTP